MNNKIYIAMTPAVSRLNRIGKCVIRCRITYNKQRKEFSTGLFIYPKYWNSKKQKVLEDAEHTEYTNTQLSPIINKMNQAFYCSKFRKALLQLKILTLYFS